MKQLCLPHVDLDTVVLSGRERKQRLMVEKE